MSELQMAAAFETVALVDRALQGGFEIIFDGARFVWPKGVVEKHVPQFLAEWIFSVDQTKVHTKDGEYVNRLAVKEGSGSEDFRARVGRAACDASPIEIDTDRLEGWDTDASPDAADRGNTRVVQLKRQRADFTSDAAPAYGGGSAAR